jgi:Amidohydrolase family
MRKRYGTAALLATTALALWASGTRVADGQQQAALVIQGAMLIDGNGGPPVPNSVIVVQGNRIAAVGRAGQVQVPEGVPVIDATGKWVTPGLVDAKANWNWMYGEGFLHWGVTSAMVTGARNDEGIAERDAINHGIFEGPRLYQGVINMRGGGPKGDRPDNYRPGNGSRVAGTVEAAIALAKSNLEGGADFLGTDDGDGPPEIFAAYAKVGHDAGKGVVMRCVGPETRGRACILAGADVMIHTGELGVQMNRDPEKWKDYVGLPPDAYCDMDPQKEKEMVAFVASHNTALEPDFMAADRGFPSMWKRVQQETHAAYSDPAMLAYYPQFSIEDVYDNQQSKEDYLTPDQISLRECGYKNHAKFIGDVVAAGGHVVAASDITQTPPGLGLHQEMAVMQEDAHMPPMKVLQAATKWVAEAFRIKDIGTIEPGKFADIDILDADPLADITNMRRLDTVIKDGKVVDRAYHPWYRGDMFSNTHEEYDNAVVSDITWERGLKAASRNRTPKPLFTVTAPNGHPVTIGAGANDVRRGPGLGPVPHPTLQPTPGIETLMPHTVIQGTTDTTFTLTGINFTTRSVVFVDGHPVPTNVESGTKLTFGLSANQLAEAGKRPLVVKNPRPLDTPSWGATSNTAHILVPFSFTTAWSHNRY